MAAVLTAAGSGTRLGAAVPKALVPLGGRALVAVAAERLAVSAVVSEIVVTAPAAHLQQIRDAVLDVTGALPVQVVPGGQTRQASVAAGLAALSPTAEVVLVHDAARPLASPALVQRLVATVRAGHDAVIPAVPVVDTIKEVDDGDPPVAVRTVNRSALRAVQTPQAFRGEVLRRAHQAGAERAANEFTAVSDDAGLVEALGLPVHVIAGERAAIKVTTLHDLAIAELYLREGE